MHALDKRVSGLLLLARTKQSAKALAYYFSRRDRLVHTFSALASNPMAVTTAPSIIESGLVKSGTKMEKMRIIEYRKWVVCVNLSRSSVCRSA